MLFPLPINIPDNEKVDHLAKQAAINGRKPKFKISYTDYCAFSARDLRKNSFVSLKENFLTKGKLYHSCYYKDIFPTKSMILLSLHP